MTDKLLIEELERAEFEAWMASGNYPEIAEIALARIEGGHYKSQLTHAAWQTWLARARVISELRAQLATIRAETVEACAKIQCRHCARGLPFGTDGWHWDKYTRTDGTETILRIACDAEAIRSLQHAEPQE